MKRDWKVVLTERITDSGLKRLQQHFRRVVVLDADDNRLLEEVRDAQVIVTRLRPINRELIESAKLLRVIVRHGVGTDNIDIESATEHDVLVAYTPESLSVSVAEYTISAILALLRLIREADRSVRVGNWNARQRELIGTDLSGRTIGIVGLGRIGFEVAKRLGAFGANLSYYDLIRHREHEKKLPIKYSPLNSLLKRSDIICLHVPASENTFHMIGEKQFALMKQSAVLINMSRGSVVAEDALIKALSKGRLKAAALDVFEREPPHPDNPLLQLPNVLLSPHMSGHTKDALEKTSIAAAQAVIAASSGRKPNYLANPELLKRTKKTLRKK